MLQLDDLIVALRAMQEARNDTVFGCSLDLAPGAQKTAQEVARRFNGASNAALAQQVKNALGPQQVRILGIPGDSRLALAMVTADYRLKRTAMGAESLPGVGNAVSTGVATNRVWFEPAYDAVAVSDDGLSYQIAGPRLKVLAGRIDFDTKDATPAATAFAKRFSEKIPDAAMRIIEYADLQNVTDLFLVAALIKQDNLAKKSALDFTWILSATNYKPASLPVPKTAETIMADANGMITEGGVLLAARSLNGTVRGKADMQLASRRTRPDKEWFLTRKIER
ncbi:MAG TPA: DUF1598 domain-containing protein [Phycisphaerae bacterium]|nr:DUF1598 domain-containing protein [Phycisphaerae bacterium]